jgi:hypothetical protein
MKFGRRFNLRSALTSPGYICRSACGEAPLLILALGKGASGSWPRRCECFSTSERIALLAPPIRSKAQICHALRSLDQSLVRTKIGRISFTIVLYRRLRSGAPEGSPRGLFVEVVRPVFEQLVARAASGLGISGIGLPTATLETISRDDSRGTRFPQSSRPWPTCSGKPQSKVSVKAPAWTAPIPVPRL